MRIAFCIHPAEYLLLLQEGKTAASDEDDLDLNEDESEGTGHVQTTAARVQCGEQASSVPRA